MKKTILISIKPEYVTKIINGEKKFEYRTKAAKQDINKILIYETSPKKKIVASAIIEDVLFSTPIKLWEQTSKYSGISKKDYFLYFKNRKIAYAYKLGKINVFEEPQTLKDYGLKMPPQSFIYIEEKQARQ